MFDPVELAKETEKIVTKNGLRKYYRFRPASFYGGIATADCVGCNLRCIFCWAYDIVRQPEQRGQFYSAKEVAKKLIEIAKKYHFQKIRISGNEPTLAKEHLIQVLEQIPNYNFILETNGIMVGYDSNYAKQLKAFPNLHVRVSLKGTTPEEFSRLTGARAEAFELQLKALENLVKAKVSCHAALIELAKEDREGLRKRLKEIRRGLDQLELEPLILYPEIKERLIRADLIQ